MFSLFSYEAFGSATISVAGTIVYTALYRLYFHPLAIIPGPMLAALTFYYEIYFNVVKPGMFVWEIQRLHRVYGMFCLPSSVYLAPPKLVLEPIVRINPREVHISDLDFLDEIYSTSRPRNKDEIATSTLDLKISLGGTCQHAIHKGEQHLPRSSVNRKSRSSSRSSLQRLNSSATGSRTTRYKECQ